MNLLHLNIGSNQNRRINIRLALNKLESNFTDITVSSLFESPAEGFVGSNFYNVGVNASTDKKNILDKVTISKSSINLGMLLLYRFFMLYCGG